MPSGIVSQRVPLIDNDGKMTVPWFRFFQTLYNLTGGGSTSISLTDLMVGPPTMDAGDVVGHLDPFGVAPSEGYLLAQTASLAAALQGLQLAPVAVNTGPTLVGVVVATLDFPSTLAQTSSVLTITVPGAVDGDVVTLGVPNACTLADSCYTGWVSGPDTASVQFNNYSAGPQNPPSGDFRAVVTRY